LCCCQDIRNTVGNIPMEWYREFEHIGYDLLGKKIIKPEQGDELDEFVNRMDNPDYWYNGVFWLGSLKLRHQFQVV